MPENENIIGTNRLISPSDLKKQIHLSERGKQTREKSIGTFRDVIKGRSEKIAIIV